MSSVTIGGGTTPPFRPLRSTGVRLILGRPFNSLIVPDMAENAEKQKNLKKNLKNLKKSPCKNQGSDYN